MNNKEKYGEVTTNPLLIKEMYEKSKPYFLEYLRNHSNNNETINILDIGTGNGIFIKEFIDFYPKICKNITFYGIDKNPYYESIFLKNFQNIDINIKYINNDFLCVNNGLKDIKFDIIIGNPPFNNDGLKKVPCNNKIDKKHEGKAIWYDCIKKALTLIKNNGYLLFISPCLWLKPDKSGCYDKIVNENKLMFIKSYNSLESYKLFKYKAQTPVNYFLSQKIKNKSEEKKESYKIKIYETNNNDFIYFNLKYNYPIPTHNLKIVNNVLNLIKRENISHIYDLIVKSNPISKKIKISDIKNEIYTFKNIKTTIINKKSKDYELVINYSDKECPYNNEKKIVNSHKRLFYFKYDKNGEYGISTRDNIIILCKVLQEKYKLYNENIDNYMFFLEKYLNHNKIKNLLECIKYRMNYSEKYAYYYVPNIIDYVIKKDIKIIKINKDEENNIINDFLKLI